MKLYQSAGDMPTYYLQDGQEFQIELYNPTSDVVLAKIYLNGKVITQGGLVLNPAQRVFLDRYIDVAQKFRFETYEVTNNAEARKAIEKNGDIKVEFFKEMTHIPIPRPEYRPILLNGRRDVYHHHYNYNMQTPYYVGGSCSTTNLVGGTITTTGMGGSFTASNTCGGTNINLSASNASPSETFMASNLCMDSLQNVSTSMDNTKEFGPISKSILRSASLKKIETGRVEMGGHSDQKLVTVNKDFYSYPFHTVEYKMLPLSQKVNTSETLNVKRYCTNCSAKAKKEHKFCANCGERL
jgi:hypothetical protein